jgi:RimJ/RimL family protein N-acetyltransferase
MVRVILQDVVEDDLPVFFEYQQDPLANHMAAFTPKDPADREAFMAHWARILSDDTVTTKTILLGDQVVGSVGSYVQSGETEVTYWIGREHWGKGIATDALSQLLGQVKVRPLHARAAKDNFGSIRVLEKCGFVITGYDRGFANARSEEIEEVIMELQD